MTPKEKHHTLLTAIKHGGGFMSVLAEAALHADDENRSRLFAAFPELFYRFGPQTGLYNEEL